jgi:Spy/CpxP family protein refolding chaperone
MRTFVRMFVVIGSVAAAAVGPAARADVPPASQQAIPGAPQQPSPPAGRQPSGAPQQPPPPGAAQQPSPGATQQPSPGAAQQPSPGAAQQPSPGAAQQQGPAPQQPQAAASEANDIVQMVDAALQGITLRPDQVQQFQALGADVDAKVADVEKAKRDALLALADEIESGKVDAASLKPKTEQFVAAADAASPVVRHAFEKLHDALDADQRKQFISNFREELKKRAAMVGRKATLEEMSKTLNLTDDQKTKIQQILSEEKVDSEVARERYELVLAAFQEDEFSMDDLLPAASIHHRGERMVSRMVDIAAKITDVLTPEQRKIAAKGIRDRVAGKSTEEPGAGKTTEEPGAGKTTEQPGAGKSTSSIDVTSTTSEALWAGGRTMYATRYRGYGGGWGFSRGYAAGFGGGFLF